MSGQSDVPTNGNGNGTARRPTSLLAQLKCFWQLTDELREDVDNLSPGGGQTDPGDLTVYFENGLAGA